MATVGDIYLEQIVGMSDTLLMRVGDMSDEQLAQRPGEYLNPVGFIYWHILRIWDFDLNLLIRGQDPSNDAWHRGGMTELSGYNPDGHGVGGRGIGFGYTDAEVDEMPYHHTALRAYHDLLLQETKDFLANAEESEFAREVLFRDTPTTVGARMQHAVAHSFQHIGEIMLSRGLLGFADPTTPPRG